MSIESFFTLQTSPTAQSGKTTLGGNAGLGAATSVGGLSFVDFILGQVSKADKGLEPEMHDPLQSGNPALEKNTKLDIERIIADNPEIVEDLSKEIEKFLAENGADLEGTLTLNKQAFGGLSQSLSDKIMTLNISDDTREAIAAGDLKLSEIFFIDTEKDFRPVFNKLKAMVEKVQKASENGEPQAITANLTPEELTALQDYLAKLEAGEEAGEEPENNLLIGLVKLLPPQSRPDIILTGQSVIIAPRALNLTGKGTNGFANDTISQLNSLSASMSGEASAGVTGLTEGAEDADSFKDILKAFAADNKEAKTATASTPGDKTQAPPPDSKPNASYLQGWPFTLEGSLFAPVEVTGAMSDELGAPAGSALNVTSLNNLTNPIAQSQSAGSSHPASQLVAATMQKAAKGGQDTTIKLQLDPPELGRVEVRMHFGKDKSMKTSVIAEKPETLAMLQRDAHALERALQDAGLDLADNAMSFDLAQDGHDFSHNGGHDSQGGSGGTGGEQGEEIEITESQMTWHVDSETGHMRYNILA